MFSAACRKKIDKRAIAADNPGLRASSGAHPFLAKRQDTGPRRIGGIVTLNHSLDEAAQPIILRTCEIPSKEIGDGHVVCQCRQRRVQIAFVRVPQMAARQRSTFKGPALSCDRLQREARFA